MKRTSFFTLLCLCLVVLNAGCVRTHNTRGNFINDERIAQIKPGMTQDDVIKTLGTPSFHGIFKDDLWYYYGVKESTVAFLSPRIDDTRVVKVTFDQTGHVSTILKQKGEINPAIVTSNKKTVDLSHKSTLFRKLFGNVGRFSKTNEPMKPRVGPGR